MHQMPPGDADTVLAVALAADLDGIAAAREVEDVDDRHAMFLSVALSAARKARMLIEDVADADDLTKDAATLRQVYAHLLDIMAGVAPVLGAIESQRQARDLAMGTANTERPSSLRLVK